MASRNKREGHYIGHVWRRHVRRKNRHGGPWSVLATVAVLSRSFERGTIRVRRRDEDGDPIQWELT